MFCYNSTKQTADSEAQIPTSKNAAVCRSALVVTSHIYEHVEEGWIKMTVAQTDETGRKIIGYRMLDGNKDDETNKRKQHSFSRILR